MIKDLLRIFEEKVKKYKTDVNNNIIVSILEWFIDFFDLFFDNKIHNKVFKKWDIYIIELWINIWSELNKQRPCIIYSTDKINRWNCLIVLPLKTLKKFSIKNNYSITVSKNNSNQLDVDSYLNITDMRSVSKKRISKYIWKIDNIDLERIDLKVLQSFWIKQKDALGTSFCSQLE